MIDDIFNDPSWWKQETWKEYVQYHIKEDDPELDIDSLREEEKSLYENGYISAMELYFGEVKTEEEI